MCRASQPYHFRLTSPAANASGPISISSPNADRPSDQSARYKTNDHRERIESAYRALHLGRHRNDYACNFKDIYPTSTFHAIETRTRCVARGPRQFRTHLRTLTRISK